MTSVTDEIAWLDVQCDSERVADLFDDRNIRTVQFRYVSVGGRWHLGHFGAVVIDDNYAPFKNSNTWRTRARRNFRPVVSACESSDTVTHDYPSRIAKASPNNRDRICRPCLKILHKLRSELAAVCEFKPHEFDQLADHLFDCGQPVQQSIVCLANAFDGIQQEGTRR